MEDRDEAVVYGATTMLEVLLDCYIDLDGMSASRIHELWINNTGINDPTAACYQKFLRAGLQVIANELNARKP